MGCSPKLVKGRSADLVGLEIEGVAGGGDVKARVRLGSFLSGGSVPGSGPSAHRTLSGRHKSRFRGGG